MSMHAHAQRHRRTISTLLPDCLRHLGTVVTEVSHVRKRIRGTVKKQRIIDGKEEDLDLTLLVHDSL